MRVRGQSIINYVDQHQGGKHGSKWPPRQTGLNFWDMPADEGIKHGNSLDG